MTHNFSQILGIVTLIFSIVFFGLGVCFPLLSTHKQLIFIKFDYDEINLLDSIAMFFDDREYFLAAVILIFTFILPILKYIELTIRILRNKTTKILQNLDKWNMIDVFLVALLLLNFKMNSNIIAMELRIGTTFIALSVIFRILTIVLVGNNKIVTV